jgi:APA family basic amino acid/polyamine antiporter
MSAKLQRNIGLITLILYGTGDILGAGIYGLVGKAAGEMGNAAWLGFLVSMLAASMTGLSYASIGSRYPTAAGAVYSVSRAYRRTFISYSVGMALLASGLTSLATACHAFAGYFQKFVNVPITVIIVCFALAITFLVFWGIKESLFTNSIFTVIEVGGLLFIIALGISFIGDVDYFSAVTDANPTGELSFPLLVGGAVLTFYSFIGFEDLLNVAEETKNPRRNLPIALITSIAVSSTIYILICLIAVAVIPAPELAASGAPLVTVVGKIAPWVPPSAFSLIALIAVSNTALLNFIMGSRLLYGMSDQGLFPRMFSKVHPKRYTPHRTIMLVGAVLLILTFVGDISALARATSVLLLSCFIVVNISLVILKRREKIEGSFEVPTIVPILGALVCGAMLTQSRAEEWLIAGTLLVIIGVLYFIMKPTQEAVEHMAEIE